MPEPYRHVTTARSPVKILVLVVGLLVLAATLALDASWVLILVAALFVVFQAYPIVMGRDAELNIDDLGIGWQDGSITKRVEWGEVRTVRTEEFEGGTDLELLLEDGRKMRVPKAVRPTRMGEVRAAIQARGVPVEDL